MNRNEDIKFTRQPCPKCQADGTDTGYEVKIDCQTCFGTGHLPMLAVAKQIVAEADYVSSLSLKKASNDSRS